MSPTLIIGILFVLVLVRIVALFPYAEEGQDPRLHQRFKRFREYLDTLIYAGVFGLVIVAFVARTFYIPSSSMEPTLRIEDDMMVNELAYKFTLPHDGDIVVFRPPLPTNEDYVKRLIASPGDRLEVKGGVVYRNGVALDEPYIEDRPNYDFEVRNYGFYLNGKRLEDSTVVNVPPRKMWISPDRVPRGCYIMFGDNRNDSYDSHLWGCAERSGPRSHFIGKAQAIFWPLAHARWFGGDPAVAATIEQSDGSGTRPSER